MAKLANFTDFEFPPEGRHPAGLVGFIDLGIQAGKFSPSRQAHLTFEFMEPGERGKPILAFKRVFNVSTRSKNFLPIVRALTGLHDISDVDTRDLLGKACEIEIEHVTNEDGNTYANVDVKPIKGAKRAFKPVSELQFLSLQPDDFDPTDLVRVSDRQREIIMKSETYRTLMETRNHVAASKGKATAEIIDDSLPANCA